MSLDVRLKKLEAAIPPCEACDFQMAAKAEWADELLDRGVQMPEPDKSDIIEVRCPYCLTSSQLWFPGYGPQELAAELKINPEEIEHVQRGSAPDQKTIELGKWLNKRRMEIALEQFGPVFEEVIK